MKRITAFKVITVSSRQKDLFDPNQHRNFFCIDREDIYLKNLDELSQYTQTDFDPLCFRDRLIPKQKEVQIVPLGERSLSSEIDIYTGPEKTLIPISDTLPKKTNFEGIITDLYLQRDSIHLYTEPYGLGIVAWAVKHSIPVGIVYDDTGIESRLKNFWLESALDTLESHPSCFENKIISGDIISVCKGMYELLKSTH